MRLLRLLSSVKARGLLTMQGGGEAFPCSDRSSLLLAVLSLLPPSTPISLSQLKTLMGLYSRDLCGVPFRQVPGSFEQTLPSLLSPPTARGDAWITPPIPIQWEDPRPPPPLSTRLIDQVIPGSIT